MADDIKKQLKAIEISLTDGLKKAVSGARLNSYGKNAVDIIYNRTKSGKGVTSDTSNNSSLKELDELSDSYKKFRKKYKGKKGEKFSPNKSNLTLTGQLLNSIKYEVSDGKIKVYLSGTRDDGQTNKKVGEFVSENDRPFLNLANEEKQILLRKVESDLIKFIRLLFNKRG